MSLASVTIRGQAFAEAQMYDMCTIRRISATPPTYNPSTGEYDYPAGSVVYSGKCRVRQVGRIASLVDQSTATSLGQDRIRVDIPMSATDIQLNDHVTIDASLNPSMVGDEYYVSGLFSQTAASAQRLWCERTIR